MKVSGTPINEPRYVTVDARDLDSLRQRVRNVEDDNNEIRKLIALHMQGVKELFDERERLLLAKFEAQVARKDVE